MDKKLNSDRRINAMPTKDLFVAMLTRDVPLIPAIIDLADNCTDGARRLRPKASWKGLSVEISAGGDKFEIKDNCGGIGVKKAREYAFRFGREADAEVTTRQVGRFGIGMKRGLFKLGRHFRIRSTTRSTQFSVTIDVEEWERAEPWEFQFDTSPIESGKFPPEVCGTTITVTRLHDQVKEQFERATVIEELRQGLTSKLEQSLDRGLAVKVNGVSLQPHTRKLVADPELAPARRQLSLHGATGRAVTVDMWCGLGKPMSPKTARKEAGWYVFCNGRMLLEADKTTQTAWGNVDGEELPVYHAQFNDFRGYAYLDADDAADLPWNTGKTSLDTDHPVYRRVRQEMARLARPVVDYLNKRKKENDDLKAAGDDGGGSLQLQFDNAKTKPVTDIKFRSAFSSPSPRKPKRGSTPKQLIAFEAERRSADKVRRHLRAGSWKSVGEGVFSYYYNAECTDE